MDTIKILGVAPYPEMDVLLQELAKSYENVEMYTFTGFYENAIAFTKAFPNKDFDIVISRGGTATLLRELIDTPVVNVDVSIFDLLRVVMQALQYSKHAAVVSYPYVTSKVDTLAQILRLNIQTISFETAQDIPEAVRKSREQGIELIIGGAATREYAVAAGAQFILITSGRDCVEDSIKKAINQYHLIHDVSENNRFFQAIVERSKSGFFLFDESQHIRYANVAARQLLNDISQMEHFLLHCLPKLKEASTLQLFKKFNNAYYEIYGSLITLGKQTFFLFEFRFRSQAYPTASFASIEGQESLQMDKQQLGSSDLYLRPIQKYVEIAASSALPVLIQGAVGTKKGLVARCIHSRGPFGGNSFICLQCSNITEKNWKALMNNIASPIHAIGYTIYFDNICELSDNLQREVAAYIEDTQMTRRHKLISSSERDLSREVSCGRFSSKLYLLLSGLTIDVPGLKQRREDIPSFVNMLLPQYNVTCAKAVIGMEPDAMNLLINFSWPLNLIQLERVLRHLVASASSFYIPASEVATILRNENNSTSADSFNWSGTLDEIERKVIFRILHEENMNQSAAAKRLGISRSTLWRKLSST